MTPEERKRLDESIKGLEQKRIYYDQQLIRVNTARMYLDKLDNTYFPTLLQEMWQSPLIDKRHDSFYDNTIKTVADELSKILEYEKSLLDRIQ